MHAVTFLLSSMGWVMSTERIWTCHFPWPCRGNETKGYVVRCQASGAILRQEAPPPTQEFLGTRTRPYCPLILNSHSHCIPWTNMEGILILRWVTWPWLLPGAGRQQKTHFHQSAEISSNIRKKWNMVWRWICYLAGSPEGSHNGQ